MEIFFDYTCPFAYRAHKWLDPINQQIKADWRPFSLLERNYRGDGPSVWDLDERRDDISLLLFAGHSLVNARHGDINRYRRMMFSAWHDGHRDLDKADILRIVVESGLNKSTELDLREHFRDAAADHRAAETHGVFGSPTIVFDPGTAAFVKLDSIPEPDAAIELLSEVHQLATRSEILEVHRAVSPTVHPLA